MSQSAAESSQPAKDERPKVFISYSWTSREHKQWVMELAERLTSEDVHALLDAWDLGPGADSLRFMERMVNDPEVRKVIIVADKAYVEKANDRIGGVGTETQIISPELYGRNDSGKFVLVVAENDENGKAYLPTYYKGKIYIDLSDTSSYEEEFDRLLRWIYEKPAAMRPEFGAPPEFTLESAPTSLGTLTHARRAMDAMRTGKQQAMGSFLEYLNTLARNLERLRIAREAGKEFDDQVVESFAAFKPTRDEFANVLEVVMTHTVDLEVARALRRFFEQIYPYNERPKEYSGGTYTDADWDNFRLICRELFLVTSALALKHQRFDVLHPLLEQEYYITAMGSSRTMYAYGVMCREVESIEYRKRRLQSRRANLIADLFMERTDNTNLTREDLLQADFVLHLRARITGQYRWHPATHVFAATIHRAFEIFARSSSRAFFQRFAPVLGTAGVDQVKMAVEGMQQYGDGHNSGDPSMLTGVDELCTHA